LIQNTQNRDTKAVHLKLDELIKAIKGARNNMVDIENLSDEELDRFQTEFKLVHEKAQQQIDRIQSVKLKKKNK
jgi:low affinity Fe/Cu permease